MNNKPVLINIGCGSTVSNDWINIDKSLNAWISNYPRLKSTLGRLHLIPPSVRNIPFPKGIRYRDIHKKGLPGADNSADWVYNSHLIPCMTRSQTEALFAETYRVLKPGGKTRIVTADMGIMAKNWQRYTKAYLESDRQTLLEGWEEDKAKSDLPNGDLLNLRLALHWFSRSGMPRWRRFFDYPIQYIYDFESLAYLLQKVGFTDVTSKNMFESEMPSIREIETRDNSIYAEATKP